MEILKPSQILKGQITELDENLSYFIVQDFIDSTYKTVQLSGKQMMWYTTFSIGDVIYAVKTADDNWKLVTGTDFKRSSILKSLRVEVDSYLKNIDLDQPNDKQKSDI